jgi:Flp pilus assembly protein TadB
VSCLNVSSTSDIYFIMVNVSSISDLYFIMVNAIHLMHIVVACVILALMLFLPIQYINNCVSAYGMIM